MAGALARAISARTILCALAALGGATPAAAGALRIDPVRVDLTEDRRIGAIRIVNQDDAPVSIRAHALRWEQRGGEDVRSECADVIASPPIFTIPPGGAQLLRVALRDGRIDRFRAYRLIVEEIPRAAASPGAINVALRLDLPLYALTGAAPASPLRWTLAPTPDGQMLEATNAGGAPVQVQAIGWAAPSGRQLMLSESMGVVLPGSMRRWRVGHPLPAGGATPLRLFARTDFGEQSFEIAATGAP